jgi:aminoglycoside 6'-N-acetyltransferase
MDLFIDPVHHRRGYATDALKTVIGWLIDTRGHHRLVIDPHLDNAAAIACYEKVGFRRVGIMHQYISVHGGPWLDAVLMELLAKDLIRS